MEKRVILAVVLTVLAVLLLGAYINFEPQRQASAAERQKLEAIDNGVHLFATLCTPCHGTQGEGKVGPALANGAFMQRRGLKAVDPGSVQEAQTLIEKTISRGVAKTPMPAWLVDEGGSLNDEQIFDLASLVLYGGPDDWQNVASLAPAPTPAPAPAQEAASPAQEPASSASGDADLTAKGRQLFQSNGCVACHGENAEGGVGPNLAGKTEDQILKQVRNPVGGVMPAFPADRLSDADVHAIAAFIASLSSSK